MMNKPKLEIINPEIAREMLKCNTHNLPVRRMHVDYLASEMASGRWQLTHQGIAFDGNTLVDGQHRLLAVIQSGKTIEAWVFGNVPIGVQALIDKGRIRSVGDELMHFDGCQYAKQKASACRAILSMCCHFQNIKMSSGGCKSLLTEFGSELEFVIDATKNFKPAHRSWICGSLAFCLSANRAVEDFVVSVGSGENLKHGDPAKALRDWLANGGVNIGLTYKRHAIEGVFNAAYNACSGGRITFIKRGAVGMNYFMARKRIFVSMVREDYKQQLDTPDLSE